MIGIGLFPRIWPALQELASWPFQRFPSLCWSASARYPSSDTAQKIALRDCERIMGGGCGTAWLVDGYMAPGGGADGRVNWGLGQKKGR
jgi:hypothetical protein